MVNKDNSALLQMTSRKFHETSILFLEPRVDFLLNL